MHSSCMVHTVAFWPLDEIANPLRGSDICMLKYGQECRHQQENGNGLRVNPNDRSQAQAAKKAKTDYVQWTKVKRTECIHALGTMMHLMKYAPERDIAVHGSVPQLDYPETRIALNQGPRSKCCRKMLTPTLHEYQSMPSAYVMCFYHRGAKAQRKSVPQIFAPWRLERVKRVGARHFFWFQPEAGLWPLRPLWCIIDLTEGETYNQHTHVNHTGHPAATDILVFWSFEF